MIRRTQTIASELTVALVWVMACLGITYQSLYHERYKLLETCFYVIHGVFPAIVIIDMVCSMFSFRHLLFIHFLILAWTYRYIWISSRRCYFLNRSHFL